MQFIKQQAAFTFIEVLISLFLLNIILCGVMKTELFIIKTSAITYLNTIATIQAKNLLELLHLQTKTLLDISTLLNVWQENTRTLLPIITTDYHCDLIQCHVSIKWQYNKKQYITVVK